MMKPLSVAYLVPALDYGGSETLLLAFLKCLDRSRFVPEVHCFYGEGKLVDEFRAEGIPVFQWRAPRRDPLTFFRLIRYMRNRRYSVAHTHLFDRQGRVAAYLARVPIIVTTYHLVTDWDTIGGISDRIKVVIDTLTSRLNDRIIVVSESVRQSAIEKGRIEPEKIVTVCNGIDPSPFQNVGVLAPLREALNLDRRRVVVAIGRLVEQKGHVHLVRAAKILVDEFPDLTILIVGSGPLRDQLEREISEHELEGYVRLVGERRDIPEILAIAEVFAMPSLFEGLSITLLEAMASGVPIVATTVDGIRGMMVDGVDSLLVPAEDEKALAKAIGRVLSDGRLADRLARASRDRVDKEFHIRHHARQVESIYQDLAETKGLL